MPLEALIDEALTAQEQLRNAAQDLSGQITHRTRGVLPPTGTPPHGTPMGPPTPSHPLHGTPPSARWDPTV